MIPFRSLFFFLLFLIPSTTADFGDYADTSFNCPAQTTCPVVCTETRAECPTNCPVGLNLCLDGSCKDECSGQEFNKCAELYTCTTFACPKVTSDFESCERTFEGFYETSHKCPVYVNSGALNAFSVGHVLSYLWLLGISLLIVGWGKYNERNRCYSSSSSSLEVDLELSKDEDSSQSLHQGWTQTAYKSSNIGLLLYWLTLLTWWGIQLALLILTIMYYQENDFLFSGEPGFGYEDEQQILYSFEIVWTIGFIWCFWLAWLDSLKFYFLTRCR